MGQYWRVVAFLIQLSLVTALCAVPGILMMRAARKASARMAELDASFRPIEAQTGVCEACEGAGTRLEAVDSLVPVEMRTCYRCGGDGVPPPPGRFGPAEGSWPLDSRLHQLGQGITLMWTTRKKPQH